MFFIYNDNSMYIPKSLLGLFKRNSMLLDIDLIFVIIPFKGHK